jgi:predicted ATPase
MLAEEGISEVAYEETEHYSLTRDFLNNRDRYLRQLFTTGPAQQL